MSLGTALKRSFSSMFSFFGESWSELKKVRWPTYKELKSYTIVVFLTILFVAIYFWILDIGISFIVEAII